jgi:fumarate hydratase class II
MTNFRIDIDSMGELKVPEDALYGAQTQRAVNNFPISGQRMPIPFIESIIHIKSSAAATNKALKLIPTHVADAIVMACNDLLNREDLLTHFPVDIFQTGSGTSSNMNVNEVVANLATKLADEVIDPNDHVNYGQSSNDVIPSAIHISAALLLDKKLLPALEHLSQTIEKKAKSVEHFIKTGRTHLMDAMPVSMGHSLMSWHAQINANIRNISALQPSIKQLAQGGTAVGTGINAHAQFSEKFSLHLSKTTGLVFTPADNLFALIGSQDTAVALSGALKTTAVSLMKIANDLRWMNSGPLAGLGEIALEALQPGSSIMPGKVNPVIPEATAMVCAQVIGNDAAITIGGQSGNFELNVMLPMIAANLIESLELLTNSSRLLANKAIATFIVQEDNIAQALDRNPILVTALNPIIGYQLAAKIAKTAYQEKRAIVDVALEHTDLSREELTHLLNPKKLTQGGL